MKAVTFKNFGNSDVLEISEIEIPKFSEDEVLHHQLENLVDIAIYECEKFYPAFQLVLFEDSDPGKALAISTFDTIGVA